MIAANSICAWTRSKKENIKMKRRFFTFNPYDFLLLIIPFLLIMAVTFYLGILDNTYVKAFLLLWPHILMKIVNAYRGF